MSEELRPCPFCGAMPDNERGVVRYDPGVICHTKGCLLECRWFPIDDWNTRPIEDALNKRIADLDADNAELKERVAMLDVTAVYKSLGEMGYIEQVANLKAENAVLQSRIAELEGELAELKERFDITDGLLNQATVSIGAVIACCTYNSNAEAMIILSRITTVLF